MGNIFGAVSPALVYFVVLIGIFYFFLIRPQQKKEKQIRSMRDALVVGDSIITIGGIYGTIISIKEDYIVIEVGADKTKLKITKWAVASTDKSEKK